MAVSGDGWNPRSAVRPASGVRGRDIRLLSPAHARGRVRPASGLNFVLALAATLGGSWGLALGQSVPSRAFVPYMDEPINYLIDRLDDPVARLQHRIDAGQARLEFEPKHGYLKSVLKLLDVPISSQTLVFSKTSLQYKKISPNAPRALYFNDDVYVGWVQGGDLLEVASFDPKQGAVFYMLDQVQSDLSALNRATIDCTQCHVAPGTKGVPGVLLQSVRTTATGTQASRARALVMGHETPFQDRWGGWYVTGSHGKQPHMGNRFAEARNKDAKAADPPAPAVNADISGRFDAAPYLTGHSDIVAHLVLAHQTQMHNLITLVNYKTRIALHAEQARKRSPGDAEKLAKERTVADKKDAKEEVSDAVRKAYEGPAEDLLRYLLFVDEAPLDEPVAGDSGFAGEFETRGPRDAKGRSLRTFDLKRRLFKYPCSYLVYTESFDAIPLPAKGYIERRLLEILSGRDTSPAFTRLSAAERVEILEILVATKPSLAEAWKQLGYRAAEPIEANAAPPRQENRPGDKSEVVRRPSPSRG